ncbi:hypothetical protein V8C37DRAFT_26622 [Trichoderma ceciliae]
MNGGQKQRLSMARAVFAHSKLLVMNDCFSGLDANTEDLVFDNLLSKDGLLRRANVIIVLASSDYRRVPYTDYIVLLNDQGQLHYAGNLDELNQNPYIDWLVGDSTMQASRRLQEGLTKNRRKSIPPANTATDATAAVSSAPMS